MALPNQRPQQHGQRMQDQSTDGCNKNNTLNKSTQTDFPNIPSQSTTHTPTTPSPTNQNNNFRNHLINPLSDPFVHLLPNKSEWHPIQNGYDQLNRHDTSTSNTSTDNSTNIGILPTNPDFDPFATNQNLLNSPEWHSMLNDFNFQNLQTLNPNPFEYLENFE